MADERRGRPKGLTRKRIIKQAILELIEGGYFSTWRKSSETAVEINKYIPNHWGQLSTKGTGHHLKRYKQLEYTLDSARVKSWIIKDENKRGNENGICNGNGK